MVEEEAVTMLSAIEASVRARGVASPAQILADIGARDMDDRQTACALIEELCRDGRLQARVWDCRSVRVPAFAWAFKRSAA